MELELLKLANASYSIQHHTLSSEFNLNPPLFVSLAVWNSGRCWVISHYPVCL